jgi:hypothetical protein
VDTAVDPTGPDTGYLSSIDASIDTGRDDDRLGHAWTTALQAWEDSWNELFQALLWIIAGPELLLHSRSATNCAGSQPWLQHPLPHVGKDCR